MGSAPSEAIDVTQASDDSLARMADADLAAFTELYRRYVCQVFRFLSSKTKNDRIAEDLTAQVFFKALRSAGTFNGSGTYESWVFRIARNTLTTWHRTSNRDMAIHDLPDLVDPTPSPASSLIDQEARGVVWSAVAKLPARQREAVMLRYVQECSIEEIATVTDRTSGAVRMLLHRARQRLRREYEGRLA